MSQTQFVVVSAHKNDPWILTSIPINAKCYMIQGSEYSTGSGASYKVRTCTLISLQLKLRFLWALFHLVKTPPQTRYFITQRLEISKKFPRHRFIIGIYLSKCDWIEVQEPFWPQRAWSLPRSLLTSLSFNWTYYIQFTSCYIQHRFLELQKKMSLFGPLD